MYPLNAILFVTQTISSTKRRMKRKYKKYVNHVNVREICRFLFLWDLISLFSRYLQIRLKSGIRIDSESEEEQKLRSVNLFTMHPPAPK